MDGRGIVCSKIVVTAEVDRISRELPYTEVTNAYREKGKERLTIVKRHQISITIFLSTLGIMNRDSDIHCIHLFIYASTYV